MRVRFLSVLFILFFLAAGEALSWGFFGHRTINRLAIYTLPSELMGFFKQHADYLSEHAVDADKRRYAAPEEAPRHYLDADYYEDVLPFDTIPKRWADAAALYSEDTLKAYGIGPWHLNFMLYNLTEAFKEKELAKILKLAADLGHYCGDMHVPLHTTLNYNGQLTGQKGIHGFWESRLPELYAEGYNFIVGRAEYLPNPQESIWRAFSESHAAKDSVLLLEAKLDSIFKGDKFSYENRGAVSTKVYSRAYSKAYHESLKGMVERRMRASIRLLGSLWYTAWVNAGSPKLEHKMVVPPGDSTLHMERQRAFELEHKKMLGRNEPE